MTGRFDFCCPHCEHSMGEEHLLTKWMDLDYGSDIIIKCPKCSRRIQVDVQSIPEFELSIPETREEYQARREAMIAAAGKTS
jgi:hypothetical protein